jgi:hypothetical protein
MRHGKANYENIRLPSEVSTLIEAIARSIAQHDHDREAKISPANDSDFGSKCDRLER